MILGFMIFSHAVFGQIPGKKVDGPIFIFDTLSIKKGDVIFLGRGSDSTSGNFIHITTPKKYMTDFSGNKSHAEFKNTPQGISNNYNGRSFTILNFSKISSKKNGDSYLGVFSIGPTFDGTLNMGMYKQAVDFEAAILAGEIVKINDIDFTKPRKIVSREIPQFIFNEESVQPIVVDFEGMSKSELYGRTVNWYNESYYNKVGSSLRAVENIEVEIAALKKGVLVSKIMGVELFLDIQYRFKVEFTEEKIRMSFISVNQMGQIIDEMTQEEKDSMENSEKIQKMAEDFKIEMEKMMNEISASLVDYLMK